MRVHKLAILSSISALVLASCISKQMRALDADDPSNAAIIVVADRGASAVAPENTLAAFDKAQELTAVAMETDVQLSKDGRLVVFRDDTLDTKTNLTGPVASHTWKELADVDLAHWFSVMMRSTVANVKAEAAATPSKAETTGTAGVHPSKRSSSGTKKKVARQSRSKKAQKKTVASTSLTRLLELGDLFERYGLTFQYYIVLHGSGDELPEAALKTVKEYAVDSNAYLSSSDYAQLTSLRKADANVGICYLIDETKTPDINAEIQRAITLGFQQVGIRSSVVTESHVKRAKEGHVKIFAYDSQTDDQITKASKIGVASVSSTQPDHAAKIIEAASKVRY